MTSPRETHLTNLEPNAPYFARRVASPGQPSLSKWDGVEDQYNDIVRSPTRDPGAGVTVSMDVPVTVRRCRVQLVDAVVSCSAANDYGSLKLVDLPDRNVLVLQAELVGTVVFSGDFATNDDPSIGVGTAAASNSTLATTMQNVIAKTDFTNITKDAANAIAASFLGATGDAANLLIADGASNALYLNVGGNGDILADVGTATFNGTLDVWYVDLGNVGS